ncbi:hypothetical protein CDD83_6710 [Cordyceps sp. RAO-2017]|nr:hypothetical protein CDD83_6710 [Cordyceps sp. RAO-2017]
MFTTTVARSLRRLFERYHEPPPLSEKQSRKILDGLKLSFRSQLDREYGRASDKDAAAVAPHATGRDAGTRHSAANRHLRSILANPLFSYSSEAPNPDLSSALSASQRDPMDAFDYGVAKGIMSLKRATGCLLAKKKLVSAADSRADLSSSETAVRIVRWLRSSGEEADLNFLDDPHFVSALIPFLVAEGLDAVAWHWITRIVEAEPGRWSSERRAGRASRVLAEIVRVKSHPQHANLDAAITTLLEAERRFHASPLLPDVLAVPWRSVSWLSTVEAYGRTAPSEELFDAHLATADALSDPHVVERAHLSLLHPTRPDHAPAMEFFSDRSRVKKLVRPKKVQPTSRVDPMSTVSWILSLGHDTVYRLAQLDERPAAEDVSRLLLRLGRHSQAAL